MHRTSPELSSKKKFIFTVIVLMFTAACILLIYFAFAAYRSYPVYSYVKSSQRGWSGKAHQADPELGVAPIPNSRGAEVYPIGDDIPMRYDARGFRVPVQDTGDTPKAHPRILVLGCSFTYGSSVLAEEAYPYLVGKDLGGVAVNGGVCSYGLAQMLILARKLVAEQKPDHLIVQYSIWLINRAMNQFAPTYSSLAPSPYFYDGDGLKLHAPVFATLSFDLPFEKFSNTRTRAAEFAAFLLEVGFPMFIHDDYNIVILKLKEMLGIVPAPTQNAEKMVTQVYGEIAQIARDNHAQMLIVALDSESQSAAPVPYALFPQDAIVVDAHQAMLDKLPIADEAHYEKEYMHWRGNPPELVDYHPNAKAHRIIADAIVAKIRSMQLSPPAAGR